MKNLLQIFAIVCVLFISATSQSNAQDIFKDFKDAFDDVTVDKERLKYYKEKYDTTYQNTTFEAVWNATNAAIEGISCMIMQKKNSTDDNGLNKGSIKSDFCVFVKAEDIGSDGKKVDVFDTLDSYSKKVPIIRGADWVNGRTQYKISIKENEDFSVTLTMKVELSGMEAYVTNEVHFWESNGIFEKRMFELITAKLTETK